MGPQTMPKHFLCAAVVVGLDDRLQAAQFCTNRTTKTIARMQFMVGMSAIYDMQQLQALVTRHGNMIHTLDDAPHGK